MADLDPAKVKYCVWHHVGAPTDTDSTAAATNRYHRETNGWAGIGYAGQIRHDGTLELGRPFTKQGIHTANHNHESIGFCISGNFDIADIKSRPNQFKAAVALARVVSKAFPGIRHIRHSDLRPTSCPGRKFPWAEFEKERWGMNESKHTQWLKIMERAVAENWPMLPSPPDERDWPLTALAQPVSLPPAVRLDELVPFMMDQGRCGTCVAFAGAQIKNAFANRRKALPPGGLSPLFLYARCKQEDGIPTTEGTYLRVALKVMQKDGIAPESVLPYSKLNQGACLVMPELKQEYFLAASPFRIKAYARLYGITDVKQALAAGKLVKAGVLVTDSFLKPVNGVVPLPEGRILGLHAIIICGYDDAKKAFRMVNSWGEAWGEKGFAWLTYEFCQWQADLGFKALEESWAVETEYTPAPPAKRQETLDQPPVIVNGRMMAPVRWIIENSGGVVLNYDNTTKTVTYRSAKNEIVVMQEGNPVVTLE